MNLIMWNLYKYICVINGVKHCLILYHIAYFTIVFEIIYIHHMYSYLFIYIYVLEMYTLTGVLSLIYLTCYGQLYCCHPHLHAILDYLMIFQMFPPIFTGILLPLQ